MILPTLFLFGSPEPFSIFGRLLDQDAAGGVFVMKVNERSEKTVITTGMIMSSFSAPACGR